MNLVATRASCLMVYNMGSILFVYLRCLLHQLQSKCKAQVPWMRQKINFQKEPYHSFWSLPIFHKFIPLMISHQSDWRCFDHQMEWKRIKVLFLEPVSLLRTAFFIILEQAFWTEASLVLMSNFAFIFKWKNMLDIHMWWYQILCN
jgi:hypothetical protein